MFALFGIVCFFCQCRHSSGRFPSGFALLHLVVSVSAA
jgi:hypothetical protein